MGVSQQKGHMGMTSKVYVPPQGLCSDACVKLTESTCVKGELSKQVPLARARVMVPRSINISCK